MSNNKILEKNTIYEPHIITLFVDDFNDIKKKYNSKIFDWNNFESIFNYFNEKLSSSSIKINEFIKYYYLFSFVYLNYTNYLSFINHPDILNIGLEKIVNKIKTSSSITKNLLKFSSDVNIYKIIKLNDIFISDRIKKKKVDDSNIQKYTSEYIFDLKQFDKISALPNDNYKKILNLIIYRYVICKKNNYDNYHKLFLKKMIKKKSFSSNSHLDFDDFMEQIPKFKKILNIVIDVNSNPNSSNTSNISIPIVKLINYIIAKQNDKFYSEIENLPNYILIKNDKYQGYIKINISDKYDGIEFNQYQTNYSFLHYNVEELGEYNFLKKTFTNIEINICNCILKDLSSILEFIHLITLSIKILLTNPSDIYECLYPLDYSNYYFNTFCYFLDFFKHEINNNYFYNKFIIDVVKFFYIYSYYDYYFYYSNNFVDGLINNLQYKNNMFIEFTENLKKTLKLPHELNNFPPFFSQEFDLNDIVYYNFEMPSYFKFYDLMNAIYNVFELNKRKNMREKINIFDLITNNIFTNNKSNIVNESKSISMGIDKLKKNINVVSKSNSKSRSGSSSDSDSGSGSDPDSDSSDDSTSNSNSNSNSNSTNAKDFASSICNKKSVSIKAKVNPNPNPNTKKNISLKIKKELDSNLDTEIINILDDDEKTQMENINAYVELNYKSVDDNYILDTEC